MLFSFRRHVLRSQASDRSTLSFQFFTSLNSLCDSGRRIFSFGNWSGGPDEDNAERPVSRTERSTAEKSLRQSIGSDAPDVNGVCPRPALGGRYFRPLNRELC